MKPNQKNRYNGRYNNRNKRTMILRNTALESSGPSGKLHGTALQLFEKYQAAAKDAVIQNDLVLAQTCLQYADHYMRLQNIAIANEQMLATQAQQNILNNQARANNNENKSACLANDEENITESIAEEACAGEDKEVSTSAVDDEICTDKSAQTSCDSEQQSATPSAPTPHAHQTSARGTRGKPQKVSVAHEEQKTSEIKENAEESAEMLKAETDTAMAENKPQKGFRRGNRQRLKIKTQATVQVGEAPAVS